MTGGSAAARLTAALAAIGLALGWAGLVVLEAAWRVTGRTL